MTCTARHERDVAAEAHRAYALVADVTKWPLIFAPCIAADVLERTDGVERVRLWALVGDAVSSWITRRRLDGSGGTVDFAQETPQPPIRSMSGQWRCREVSVGSLVELTHEWEVEPSASDMIAAALNRNSDSETEAVRFWAEHPAEELLFSFSDEIVVDAAPDAVYEFLDRAELWPERLGHVHAATLETAPVRVGGADVQTLDMVTRSQDGETHRTRSTRLCFPDRRIVYKQSVLPTGLRGHVGEWTLRATSSETTVTATHHVALDPAVLDDDAAIRAARARVRDALGGNSRATLSAARARTEAAGR